MSRKVHNFNAGPSQLPEAVLLKAQKEFLDWQGSGISILEMGHRSAEFQHIREQCEADVRTLLNIPDSHEVLFYTSGATLHMSLIPMNLRGHFRRADYLVTGHWSQKASKLASEYCQVINPCPDYDPEIMFLPEDEQFQVSADSAYFYFCDNETIEGIEFPESPKVEIPLISDMTSNILTRPVDFSRYGCIFAGFQKNIGPAGMTMLIIDRAMLERCSGIEPALLNYHSFARDECLPNTPAVFQWYMAGLMFRWLIEQGGIEKFHLEACKKSNSFYEMIDSNEVFFNPVSKSCRSRMNAPFFLEDDSLNKRFLHESENAGLVGLKGHRSRGGFRASFYNAISTDSVEKLITFMKDFAQRYG